MIIRHDEDGSILSEILTEDPASSPGTARRGTWQSVTPPRQERSLLALPEDTSCNRLENG